MLAEDVRSRVPLPGFDNSAMDGYAVRAADVAGATAERPAVIPVEGDIAAGERRTRRLAPNRTFRIMTGAPVPEGADAIVPVELTNGDASRVRIYEPVPPGRHARRRGEDVAEGDVVLAAGTRLGARQIALLAAAGVDGCEVTPVPRVLIVSTGDELIEPGRVPRFGEVVDSNGIMLAEAVRELGMVPFSLSGIKDDEKVILRTLENHLLRADAVVTTGGVSMGVYDAVKAALSTLGTVRFEPVAMQPGMPQGFGTIGRREVPVFTLPGNPVSAYVSFHVFVAPALRAMAGRSTLTGLTVRAVMDEDFGSPRGKQQYARVAVRRTPTGCRAHLTGAHGSHVIGGLARANALAIVPAEVTAVAAGDELPCLLVDSDPLPEAPS